MLIQRFLILLLQPSHLKQPTLPFQTTLDVVKQPAKFWLIVQEEVPYDNGEAERTTSTVPSSADDEITVVKEDLYSRTLFNSNFWEQTYYVISF